MPVATDPVKFYGYTLDFERFLSIIKGGIITASFD